MKIGFFQLFRSYVLVSLPPKVKIDDKYFVGYFESDKLIAVMDLIDGYPDKKTALLGSL